MKVVEMRVPGDKSISHRALILAALALGESRLCNVLPSDDVRATARVLRQLGCDLPEVPDDGAAIRVRGAGLHGWRSPSAVLDCGNSGTTARLLLGALAGGTEVATLTGDASLRARPMRRVTVPLAEAGARFVELERPDRLPIRVEGGGLRDIRHLSPVASAQVKSALLLAALRAGVSARIVEPHRSRDHTERMLRSLGVPVTSTAHAAGGVEITLEARAAPGPLEATVPGDFSSAAFFLALGLAGPHPIRVSDVCLNPTRTGLLAVLRRMGGRVDVEETGHAAGEPVGILTAWPSRLVGTVVPAAEIPALIDEIPMLAVLACRASGETRIEGAGELRVKESDRLAALAANLAELGVHVHELDDGLVVRGPAPATRGRVRALHDHRIAMAFGVLGALPGADVKVDTPEVAAVSFPGFWTLLQRAREGT